MIKMQNITLKRTRQILGVSPSLKPRAGVSMSAVLGLGLILLWLAAALNRLLGAEARQGSVELSTTPERAAYSLVCEKVGVRKKGRTPEIIEGLPTGTYRLTLHLEGWLDQQQEVRVVPNAQVPVFWEFAQGQVTVTTTPAGVEVWEKGRSLGKSPLSLEMPVGNHTLTFKCPGCPDQERDVLVVKKYPAPMNLEFVPEMVAISSGTGATQNDQGAGKHPVKGNDFVNSIGMKLNWIRPINGWVGVYDVTQEEYQKVMGENPSEFNGSRYPVETVSWNDAMAFCSKLTAIEKAAGTLPKGSTYTLPSDDQWSILVGDATLNDAVTSIGMHMRGHTEPVGSRGANNFGLYDTRGDVREWCLDWYRNSMNDPALVARYHLNDGRGKKFKVLRGGAWFDDVPDCLAVSYRISYPPDTLFKGYGFRCVLVHSH